MPPQRTLMQDLDDLPKMFIPEILTPLPSQCECYNYITTSHPRLDLQLKLRLPHGFLQLFFVVFPFPTVLSSAAQEAACLSNVRSTRKASDEFIDREQAN